MACICHRRLYKFFDFGWLFVFGFVLMFRPQLLCHRRLKIFFANSLKIRYDRTAWFIFTGIFFSSAWFQNYKIFSQLFSVSDLLCSPQSNLEKKTIEIHICCIVTLLHLAVQRMHEFYDVQNISLNPQIVCGLFYVVFFYLKINRSRAQLKNVISI